MKEKMSDSLLRYIDAGRPLIYINHFDFETVDRMLAEAFPKATIAEYCDADGWVDFKTKQPHGSTPYTLPEFLMLFNNDQLYQDRKEYLVVLKEIHDSIGDKQVYSLLQSIARRKFMRGDSKGYNVTVLIVDSKRVIPPELEKLASESLYFSHVYSTGTRTVRGIEALTLARPPLPGMPIVRLQGNDNLRGIWSVFRERGYDTKWIYGGYGYFDNMNAYFSGNGFTVVDRTVMQPEEITFSNIWGVCDENLFARAIKEADASHAAGKPFFNFVLTTSNHRPYTYPDGRISIPSKSGRNGGVMYADYSIGKFMEEARKHPWFDDTVFVFVADHGASSSGREEIKQGNHHIPLIIYAPKFIKPERRDQPISQIDAVPTLLSLLHFRYTGEFYGTNALDPDYVSRLFLSNYQKLAYVKGNEMVIMRPVRGVHFYRDGQQIGSAEAAKPRDRVKAPDASLQQVLDEGISYYQHSARWREFLKE